MSAMEHEDDRGSEEIIEMFCELCKTKGKRRTADGFCVDCVRYFCAECLAYHTEFLPDHVHQDKKNMPQDVCLQQCPGHTDEIIKFYCSCCNKFFCSSCKKKDHNNCKDVSHLPELVKQIEKGKEFKEFKDELENVVDTVSNIESVIEKDKESIEVISRKALSKIDSTRQILYKRLDGSFEELKKEVMTIKGKDKKDIEGDSSKLANIKSQMHIIKSNVEQQQREAKRCDLFISMKVAESKSKTFQDDLNKIEDRNVNKYEIQMKDFESLFGKDFQLGKLIWEGLKERSSHNTSGAESKASEGRTKYKMTVGLSSPDLLQGEIDTRETEECIICMDSIQNPRVLCCGHIFCTECIEQQFKFREACPTCGAMEGDITGDQPEGNMAVAFNKSTYCCGYESCGQIVITYTFPSGRHGENHPNPGKFYRGITRVAYLPNNDKGRKVLAMLKVAFERKLVFTIGSSRTTGHDGVITWNDIHHKTDH